MLYEPIWPANLDISDCLFAKTEMQSWIIAREITGLAHERLHLHSISVTHQDACANRAAVGLGADELNLEPVVFLGTIVAQQRRRFIDIHDDHVHIPVVVEISKSATTAGVRRRHSRASLLYQSFKSAVPQIPKDDPRPFIGQLWE